MVAEKFGAALTVGFGFNSLILFWRLVQFDVDFCKAVEFIMMTLRLDKIIKKWYGLLGVAEVTEIPLGP